MKKKVKKMLMKMKYKKIKTRIWKKKVNIKSYEVGKIREKHVKK